MKESTRRKPETGNQTVVEITGMSLRGPSIQRIMRDMITEKKESTGMKEKADKKIN
ncbi:MAG: hypothetical protein ACOC2K_02840 [Bacteroidota bacterium]